MCCLKKVQMWNSILLLDFLPICENSWKNYNNIFDHLVSHLGSFLWDLQFEKQNLIILSMSPSQILISSRQDTFAICETRPHLCHRHNARNVEGRHQSGDPEAALCTAHSALCFCALCTVQFHCTLYSVQLHCIVLVLFCTVLSWPQFFGVWHVGPWCHDRRPKSNPKMMMMIMRRVCHW